MILKVTKHVLEFFFLGLMTLAIPAPAHFFVATGLFIALALYHYNKAKDPYGFNYER